MATRTDRTKVGHLRLLAADAPTPLDETNIAAFRSLEEPEDVRSCAVTDADLERARELHRLSSMVGASPENHRDNLRYIRRPSKVRTVLRRLNSRELERIAAIVAGIEVVETQSGPSGEMEAGR
jgi:hypothetical protein